MGFCRIFPKKSGSDRIPSQPILIDVSWKSKRRCQLSARIRSLPLSALYRESLAHRMASRDPATHPTSFHARKTDSADLLRRDTAHLLCVSVPLWQNPWSHQRQGSTNCPKCGPRYSARWRSDNSSTSRVSSGAMTASTKPRAAAYSASSSRS